jgi:hypothetical protein
MTQAVFLPDGRWQCPSDAAQHGMSCRWSAIYSPDGTATV